MRIITLKIRETLIYNMHHYSNASRVHSTPLNYFCGTSLLVQCLKLGFPNAGGLSSVPEQETRSYVLQVSVHMLQLKKKKKKTSCSKQKKTQHVATKTQCSQINKVHSKKFATTLEWSGITVHIFQ